MKRSASAPYSSMSSSGIDDVALRLRHLGALRVAHDAVDVDVAERYLVPKWIPIMIIRATQKKMMSKPVISVDVG